MSVSEWFEVIRSRPYLYTIRERLDRVDPRFYTKYTNIFLIVGEVAAIMVDTGIGVKDLRSLVESIIADKELMIINTHNHFDHVGNNYQFDETHVHRLDFKKLIDTMDLEFLKGCNEEFQTHFDKMNWEMKFAKDMVPLIGNEIINLGGIEVEIIYSPGHTPGSICILTSRGELLTGDTIQYGAVYLPSKDRIGYLNASIDEVYQKIKNIDGVRIFPGHEEIDIDISIFEEYYKSFNSLGTAEFKVDRFLQARIYEMNKFTFILPFEPSDPDRLTE